MKRWIGLAALAGAALGAGMASCSDMDDTGGEFYGDVGGGFASGAGSTNGAGGGAFGVPEPLAVIAPDAGPDAAPPACEALDSSKPVVLYVSADDSNSMASPALARERLSGGAAPQAIRTYEFLNYYRIAFPTPPAETLSIVPELELGSAAGQYDLQIGIVSFAATKPRRPITMTLVLDTSGSMEGASIERERAAVKAIAASLAEGDIVSMVTWNTANNVVLAGYPVTGPNDAKLLATAEALTADGGTDLHGGLVAGYDLAKKNYGTKRLNRVVLISDGGANVGVTDEDLIAENSLDADQEGIYLLGVGTGPAEGYNDLLMDVVTDKGRGAYVYLDRPEEATHMFVDRFDEVMEIAARSVQVEMTMPWYFQMEKFYGEEYSENADEIEPQHLAPGDATVLSQVIKACDPSVVKGSDTIRVKTSWEQPLSYAKKETSVEITVGALLAGPKTHLKKGKAIVAYAEALKAGTPEALKAARETVLAANTGGTDPELSEIGKLIESHPAF